MEWGQVSAVSITGLNQGNYKNTRLQTLLNFTRTLGRDFDLHATAGAETYRN